VTWAGPRPGIHFVCRCVGGNVLIDIKNLTKVFDGAGQQVVALDNVSLTVEKGEIFGIIGLSGAGKSTLVRCINMLEQPTAGQVFVDGREITSLKQQELRLARQKIGMIFQHFNLLSSRTVSENVLFPLEIAGAVGGEARQRVADLLALVGLTDKADVYPDQLSGGQKQRVGIARALANDPKVLLSDEATSALDPQTTRSILELLRDINRQLNLTILLITHDMQVIKEVCDRVAVIDAARIVEIGDVLRIFSGPRSPAARSLINTVISREIPPGLFDFSREKQGQAAAKLIRVSFIGAAAGEPVISAMIKKFDVDANILYGNVDRIKDTPFGNLTLELIGEPGSLTAALEYLASRGLEVEVLPDA
jgi:D-methionine transport system ATP-binding protein